MKVKHCTLCRQMVIDMFLLCSWTEDYILHTCDPFSPLPVGEGGLHYHNFRGTMLQRGHRGNRTSFRGIGTSLQHCRQASSVVYWNYLHFVDWLVHVLQTFSLAIPRSRFKLLWILKNKITERSVVFVQVILRIPVHSSKAERCRISFQKNQPPSPLHPLQTPPP